MTTKQITDQSTPDSTAPVNGAAAESAESAEDASRQLLAKARYDAFRLMTEARDEAETILDEARAEATQIAEAANTAVEAARDEADVERAAIIESAREEAAAIVASAYREAGERKPPATTDADLKAEHRALSERVSTLRGLADQLEDRFAALAATAAPDPVPASKSKAVPTIDYSPSVDPVSREPKDTVPTEAEDKRSFYDRRSAKLPRLGEDGGRGALNMTRSIRESLESE